MRATSVDGGIRNVRSPGGRPRVAWFAPADEPRSRAAYFSDLVVPRLDGAFEIEEFSAVAGRGRLGPSRHYLSAARRHAEAPFDLFVYHVEDAPWSRFSRFHLGLEPGMVVFHDLLFEHRPSEALAHSPWQVVTERFHDPSVPLPDTYVWPERPGPIGERECALALFPVFTAEWACGEFARTAVPSLAAGRASAGSSAPAGSPASAGIRAPAGSRALPGARAGARGTFIGYPVVVPEGRPPRPENGGPPRLVAYHGRPRIEDRYHKVLAAAVAAADAAAPLRLRWAVPPEDVPAAEAACREAGLGRGSGSAAAEIVEAHDPAGWAAAVAGADLAVHVRVSLFGSVNPYLPLSLAAGVPAVVSDFAQADYLPDDVVFKVTPGETETARLAALFRAPLPPCLGHAAREHAREWHDPDVTAAETRELVAGALRAAPALSSRWREVRRSAREEVFAALASREGRWSEGLAAACRDLGWTP